MNLTVADLRVLRRACECAKSTQGDYAFYLACERLEKLLSARLAGIDAVIASELAAIEGELADVEVKP